MNLQRHFLVITIMFVFCLIWKHLQIDLSYKPYHQTMPYSTTSATTKHPHLQGKIITVRTDVLSLQINTYGGDIEQTYLLPYSDKLGSSNPIQLLETSKEFIYQAQSGLTGTNGLDNFINGKRPLYKSQQDIYVLTDKQSELIVPLTYTINDIVYTKTFILKRSDFAVTINYSIYNTSSKPLVDVIMFGQLKQSIDLPATINSRSTVISSSKEKYKKFSFKKLNNKNIFLITNGGWVAMLQKYFTAALVPFTPGKSVFYVTNLGNGQLAVGFKSSPVTVAAGKKSELQASLWLGPERQDRMAAIAKNLNLVVDYGLLRFISQPMLKLLKYIHSYISNWGLSIIIITLIVRGLMYPLTKLQYNSIAKMRLLHPKLVSIRERFRDNKQRQNQEIILLYKKEQVNPLGGLLPILIQMPIFLALYHVIANSIELRHASFVLWIHDLSAHDPYYILPILMGITMFFIQKISPTKIHEPMQNKILLFMPVIFTVFFLWFPSGLVLYYFINNLVTITQQQLIYRRLKKNSLFKLITNKNDNLI